MQIKELLGGLRIGSSVAEFDDDLERYFVETETFRALIQNRVDVIAGDKGTGKTAIFRILQKRYGKLAELDKVEVIAGFNPTGNPVFQRLAQQQPLAEADYTTIWKAYVLSLVGNWLLALYEGEFSANMVALDELLKKLNIRSADDTASTIFSKIVNVFSRLFHPTAAQAEIKFHESGIPTAIIPRIEFGEPKLGAPNITVAVSL